MKAAISGSSALYAAPVTTSSPSPKSLTEDKDFGRVVFADRRASGGVLLLRFPARARSEGPPAVLSLVEEQGTKLSGSFTVVQPGRARIRSRPRED